MTVARAVARAVARGKETGALTVQPEFGAPYTLPAVCVLSVGSVGELDGHSGVVEIATPNGPEHRYLDEDQDDFCQIAVRLRCGLVYRGRAVLLAREKVGVDYGGNEHRRRVAPERTVGVAAPVGALPCRAHYDHHTHVVLPTPTALYGVRANGGWARREADCRPLKLAATAENVQRLIDAGAVRITADVPLYGYCNLAGA